MIPTFYSDAFPLPLPPDHRFPIDKYRRLRERIQAGALSKHLSLQAPEAASDEQLLRVHTDDYLRRLKTGGLSSLEERRIGFPWSPEMVERSRRSAGGTLAAAHAAVTCGAGVHLAGGTHHAFADHGQGFCVFNDVAVALRDLQASGLVQRAVIIDLDVHQGNGTAALFSDDPYTYTFSMHGAQNFPFRKRDGDLDIALPAGAGDAAYLAELCQTLRRRLPLPSADIVFYLAGADPYAGDKYGTLRLSRQGLRDRDRLVFEATRNTPVVVVMAGGYAPIDEVVAINLQTLEELVASRPFTV